MVEASNELEAKIANSLRVGETVVVKTETTGITTVVFATQYDISLYKLIYVIT